MKKYIILALGIFLMTPSMYSQTAVQRWTEDFDGNVTFTPRPSGSWVFDTTHYLPGSSATNPRSYRGLVPKYVGDTTILETPVYDCTDYNHVLLRFRHICKVSPLDIVKIQYRTDAGGAMSAWDTISVNDYLGSASNFRIRGFNAASYAEWRADDSTLFPSQSWWKEETFDLLDARGFPVQFRFIIIHGQQPATQASYGWLIDNFELLAATHQLFPPLVAFVSPFVEDSVYGTGPWTINARVKTQTDTGIVRPSLIYKAMLNGAVVGEDTLLMDNVKGDSLWKATIPQFLAGTEVIYSITGEDSSGNNATAMSGYVIREMISCETGTVGGGSGGDYVLQGNGTSASVYPFLHNWGYCRSMSLYPIADIDPNAVGIITTVTLRVATAGTAPFPMKIYLKTVPLSKIAWDVTDNLSWADLTQNATLVYDGNFQFAQTGWVDVPLTTFYSYSRTENLVLMCEQNCGGSSCPGYATYYVSGSSSVTPNQLMSKYADNTPPDAAGGNVELQYARPDLRISVIPFCADSNSTTVHSIDVNDTAVVSGFTHPVVVTIKNKGIENLTSAIVYYSVNGNTPQSYPLTGINLPWDFNTQATIGNYTPTINGYDTITVWVKMPNGVADNTVHDDTLIKVIYNTYDIQAKLVSSVTDTVYTTGPHEIKVRTVSVTGAPHPANVVLYIESTYQSVTTYDTLNMFLDMSDTLWKVTVPHYRFGSDVIYSIKLKDILGNDIVLSDSYYIERIGCATANATLGGIASEYSYTGSVQMVTLFPGIYELEVWGAEGGGQAWYVPGDLGSGTNVGIGGKGGYSKGTISLKRNEKIYVYVGGHGYGGYTGALIPGGFNGGGTARGSSTTEPGGSGGGASDIRIGSDSYYARVIVAGGGGGGGEDGGDYGGAGGGIAGTQGNIGLGGTQIAPGNLANGGGVGFGQGANVLLADGGGGGGGWYGGGKGSGTDANGTDNNGGGGGSGWIFTQANDNAGYTSSTYTRGTWLLSSTHYLTNAVTTDGTQQFLSPVGVNETGHAGDGFVRITPLIVYNSDSGDCLDHSVELTSINSPDKATAAAGILTPVHVTVRNRGVENLDSCYINWSLNGVVQPGTIVFRGKQMSEDFTDTITIGYYTPVMGQNDTIIAWVSMPNGEVDSVTFDDTLTISPLGCPDMRGIKNIPADFASMDIAINTILHCGITGTTILEIDPGTYTGTIDLSVLRNVLTARDTLIIRPAAGKTGDVIFTAASTTPAMRINTIRNLYVEHIMLDAAAGTHGIQIIGQCDNVEINSCVINANTTTTSSAGGCGVYYYGSSSGQSMGNIRLLNNTITNGYSGIYLYYLYPTAAAQTAATSWVRITGNTIENPYHSGIYSYYYSRYDSIANNIINTRAASATQYGMYLAEYNRIRNGIIGNKINMRGTSTSYGIYSYDYMNSSSTGAGIGYPALIANNEIRKLSSGGTFYGLYQYYNVISFINNSVYAEGSGTNYGMYISYSSTTYPCTIMNNLFISAGTATGNLALNCPTASYATPGAGTIMDYNNYYSTGTAISNLGATLPLLQTATQQNANSVSISPDFLNTANNLELINNTGLMVPRIASVNQDINGLSRLNPTMIGAYELFPTKRDLMLLQLVLLNNDVVEGQTVQVSVDAMNLGIPVTGATFGWSLNGQTQSSSVPWTATPTLGSFGQRTIPIGSFTATGANTFDIVVWVQTVNTLQDETTWNDTVSATAFMAPLAEFVEPLVGDTIGSLSFNVNVKIRGASGAPVNAPEMYVYVESCNATAYDTLIVPLVQEDDQWVAEIPKQYYNSTVIYETHISDGAYNITLRDTTYIMFGGNGGGISSDYSYTGSVQTVTLPKGRYQFETWGADGGSNASAVGYSGGKGGYSKGILILTSETLFDIYVGGTTTTNAGGWNGGGSVTQTTNNRGGGGASDVRIGGISWDYRIIVAGGGGGNGWYSPSDAGNGGHGGGLTGGTGTSSYYGSGFAANGGSQTVAGSNNQSTGCEGYFGTGGTLGSSNAGGGGGGWFGGASGFAFGAAGGGGSGFIYGMNQGGETYCLADPIYKFTNGVTAQFGEPDFIVNPDISGNGYVRITPVSAGSGDVYTGTDLGIFYLVSPENTDNEMCIDVSSPVEIELVNLGTTDYDFTNDNITIGYEIINPRRIIYSGNITIDTGGLESGESQTIELMSAMPIVAGNYAIKAWVTSAIDNYSCDDTLNTTYTPNLIALPVDEDFSSNILSSDFISIPVIGQDAWSPYTDPTSQISPPSGNGMLRYVGTYGSMSVLTTRQLDLSGVVDPELKFWYYHNATASYSDRSYTDVNVIVDGVLFTAMTLERKDAITGWQQYTIDLKPYTSGQCILIQFESMNIFDANSAQYLGRITITSTPDLAVSSIVFSPEISICALDNKDLSVVITTAANQEIDFSLNPTNLVVEFPGQANPFTVQLQGIIPGNTSNTIPVRQNVTIPAGNNTIRAYLSSPVDNNPLNDTVSLVVDIRPALSVTVIPVTGGNTDCLKRGSQVYQTVEIRNFGNIDMEEIEMMLRITGDNTVDTVKEIGTLDLQAGKDTVYTFIMPYTVPDEADYQVRVNVWLGCNPTLVDTAHAIEECADIDNLVLLGGDPGGAIDAMDSAKFLNVFVENRSTLKSFSNVVITALIQDKDRQTIDSLTDVIASIGYQDTESFTFAKSYTVPHDSTYFIKVYIDRNDSYPEDDTVLIPRRTNYVNGTGIVSGKSSMFTLSQNIPNPANTSTRINYSIPEAGTVVFHVHSVSGQLLHSKTIETPSGKQSLELNTSTFAAGIYFYSIEYNGQRIVKRMMISD